MSSTHSPRIAIVGAGFGGIGMAIELDRAGFHDFTVFERADRIGGVWRENTYPGAGCDVPSPFYSFSFAPNPQWPWRYSKQETILAYLERCAIEFGVADRIEVNAEVTAAAFDEATGRWEVQVNGSTESFDLLVCACGQLSEPTVPAFPGADSFTGHSFHSAHWDHEHDLRDERVAVIGTGASAIQFVPEIVPQVGALHLFQRSAPFVIPKPDRRYSQLHHRLFRTLPALLAAERFGWFLVSEYGQIALAEHPSWLNFIVGASRWNLNRAITDPAKRAALAPTDQAGCKRLLFSNNYYPALAQDHVEVIPEGVSAIGPHTVRSDSGLTREVDTIIYATGFAAHGFVAPMQITGREGRRLAEDAWAGGASAYLGMAVPDFPNLFMLYGPNTNLGSGSIVHMLESSIHYVVEAARAFARHPGARFAVRRGRHLLYDSEVQRRLATSAWASGCSSWYVDETGRNANNWPGTMSEYRWRTRQFRIEDYEALDGGADGPAPSEERETVFS
ncbi:NAD(P)/FAD-dependent oxidoreductase [Conexibacter sp. DBS9H8]|uniref:flavin-containing monooxygenase n=1 Tax=Conexibacter sp. DBS9H8 TaxID=2937801 RepID=UPI00200F6FE2|nr:NAD(P)/FAD-dependent oxidoreductase [Conexibacter sp. DBS9H8]